MTDFILWVQSASNQFLDTLFFAVTNLGSPLVLALYVIIVYWCFDKYRGLNLAFILSTSVVLNTGLKGLFRIPRPYTYHSGINHLDRITGVGWSFPSGHAQLTASAMVGLYLNFKNRIFAALALVVPILVSFSRIYLGVHTPVDVLCGMAIGAVWAWVVFTLVRRITTSGKTITLLLFCAVQLLFSILFPHHDFIRIAGLCMGFVVGFLLDETYLHFSPITHPGLKILNALLGCVIAGSVKVALSMVLPDTALATSAEYCLVGITITFLCPWIFSKLNAVILKK